MKNTKIFKLNRGFTYIEFLLYISISSVMLLVVGGMLMNIIFGKAKFTIQENIVYSHYYAVEEITRAVQSSNSINTPMSASTTSSLELLMGTEADNPTIFYITNSVLYKKIGAAPSEAITTPNVFVDSIYFQHLQNSDGLEGVQLELTLKATSTGLSTYTLYSETVSTTIFQKITP